MTDEKELIERLRRDREDALEEIIGLYTPYVLTVIRLRLGRFATPETAEELSSNVFFKLWRHRARLKTGRLRGWLSVVAANEARSFLRKEKLRTVSSSDLIPVSDDLAFRMAEISERRELLSRALSLLDETSREILIRYYARRETAPAIARALGMKPEAVKSRLWRGRQKLKTILEEGGILRED